MKISELIEKLQKMHKVVGDVSVIVEPCSYDDDYGDPSPRIVPPERARYRYGGDEDLTEIVVVL